MSTVGNKTAANKRLASVAANDTQKHRQAEIALHDVQR
jgi:hypothetical protein